MPSLKTQAIQTALTGDWNAAIEVNQTILKETPDDIDTLNRLAFAFLSLGNMKKAKNLYEKVLSLDMKNPIALRNIKRLRDTNGKKISILINNFFIEETGKTKVIDLINVADKKVLSGLRSGENLIIRIKRNKIFALDSENTFIGMLPDDIALRLIKFMEGGNEYSAYVRTADNSKISIFLKETKRAKKFHNQPSFISSEKSKHTTEKGTFPIRADENEQSENQEDESL